jgi:hypothetical protein
VEVVLQAELKWYLAIFVVVLEIAFAEAWRSLQLPVSTSSDADNSDLRNKPYLLSGIRTT